MRKILTDNPGQGIRISLHYPKFLSGDILKFPGGNKVFVTAISFYAILIPFSIRNNVNKLPAFFEYSMNISKNLLYFCQAKMFQGIMRDNQIKGTIGKRKRFDNVALFDLISPPP